MLNDDNSKGDDSSDDADDKTNNSNSNNDDSTRALPLYFVSYSFNLITSKRLIIADCSNSYR